MFSNAYKNTPHDVRNNVRRADVRVSRQSFIYDRNQAKKKNPSQHHKWLAFFSLWILFLSGILTPLFGSPGILQALQLKSYLNEKKAQLQKYESEVSQLRHESQRLLTNVYAQEKEIRNILGYVASDELIFDLNKLVY